MPDSDDTGGRTPRVTDAELLDVFRATTDPVLSTAEVADAVPIQRRGTLTRLRRLADAGELDRKDVGGRNTVWWLTAEERESGAQSAPSPAPTNDPADTADGEPSGEARPSTDASAPASSTDTDTHGDEPDLRAILPGDGANLDGRVRAVRKIYAYLKEHGSGQRSDFAELVDTEATGYSGEDPFNSFWTNSIKKSEILGELPGVETPGEGGHTYQYRPEKS